MRITWSAAADRDVVQTVAFIAADDAAAATQWLDGLLDAVSNLTLFPASGRVSSAFGDRQMRELIYGAYRVSYRVTDEIEVVRVLHSARSFADAAELDSPGSIESEG